MRFGVWDECPNWTQVQFGVWKKRSPNWTGPDRGIPRWQSTYLLLFMTNMALALSEDSKAMGAGRSGLHQLGY